MFNVRPETICGPLEIQVDHVENHRSRVIPKDKTRPLTLLLTSLTLSCFQKSLPDRRDNGKMSCYANSASTVSTNWTKRILFCFYMYL